MRARGDEVTAFDSIRRPAAVVASPLAVLAVVAIVGLIVRWLVLRSPAGVLTADEAYTGIQSFEILGGQFPIVLGGTAYTLPFEAYLYAPIAAVVGANIVTLKLRQHGVVGAGVRRRLFRRRAARRAVAPVSSRLRCVWVTPGALLLISVTAYSAYASGLAGQRRRRSGAPAWSIDATSRVVGSMFGVRRARRIRILAAPDVPRHAGADGARGAVGASAPARSPGCWWSAEASSAACRCCVEREERLAVARHAGRDRGHVPRAAPHVRGGPHAAGVRAPRPRSSTGSRTASLLRCSTSR